MKKITLLFASLSFFFTGYSQSLTLSGATTPITGDGTAPIEGTVTITNTSAGSINLMAQRTSNLLGTGHTSNFCWGFACYSDTTNTCPAGDAVLLPAGADTSVMHAWVNPHGNLGHSTVTYKFFDQDNPTDYAMQTFDYDFVTGIQPYGVGINNPLSSPSPNPSNNITSISYSTSSSDGRIIIYDLLGSIIKEVKLTSKQGALVVTTSDMKQGIYYYALVSNGKTLATKKLVVAHK